MRAWSKQTKSNVFVFVVYCDVADSMEGGGITHHGVFSLTARRMMTARGFAIDKGGLNQNLVVPRGAIRG